MAMTSYPPGVREGLPAISRLRAELLVQDRLDSLVELARRTEQIKAHVEVDDMRWRNDKLVIRTRIGMVRADGEPLTVVERGGRMLLDPELLDGIRGAEGWEVPDPFTHAHGELIVHDTTHNHWWYPDGELAPALEPLGGGRHRVVVTGETVIDPLTLTGDEPMAPGAYQVWASAQLLGVGRRHRLAPARDRTRVSLGTVAVGAPPRLVSPTWAGPGGQLRLTVSGPGRIGPTRRLLLRTTADHRLRHGVRELLRHLPPGMRRHIRATAHRADGWLLG
jgi:hypothetical protein